MSALKRIIKELKTKKSISGLRKEDLYNLGLNSTFFFDENDIIPDDEEWSCFIDDSYSNIEIKNKTFNLGKIELEFQKKIGYDDDDESKLKSLFTERWNEFIRELKFQTFFISYVNDSTNDKKFSFAKIENCPLNLSVDEFKNLLLIGNINPTKDDSIFFVSSFKPENIFVSLNELGIRTSNYIVEDYDFLIIENFKFRLKQILNCEVEVIDESIFFELFAIYKLDVKYIFDCRYLDIALFQLNYRRDYSPINLSGSIKYIVRKIGINKIFPLKGRDLRKVGINNNILKASQRYIITVEDNYYTIENEDGHVKVYKDLKYSYKEINEREVLVDKINKYIVENTKKSKIKNY